MGVAPSDRTDDAGVGAGAPGNEAPGLTQAQLDSMGDYASAQASLFDGDHFAGYGPLPVCYDKWEDYVSAVLSEGMTTVAMGVNLEFVAVGSEGQAQLTVSWVSPWKPKTTSVRVNWVISRSHPSVDALLTSMQVASPGENLVTLEWKDHWGGFAEWAEKTPNRHAPRDDHFRLDIAIDDINPGRVKTALLRCSQSVLTHHGRPVFTPLQALIAVPHLEVEQVRAINGVGSLAEEHCVLCWAEATDDPVGFDPCGHCAHGACLDAWKAAALVLEEQGAPTCPRCLVQREGVVMQPPPGRLGPCPG